MPDDGASVKRGVLKGLLWVWSFGTHVQYTYSTPSAVIRTKARKKGELKTLEGLSPESTQQLLQTRQLQIPNS